MMYNIEKINKNLYSITECDSTIMYLVIGEEKALLIDTGYGYIPIRDIIDSITDKPLDIIVTHGHPDHGLGSYQFNEVMIHEDDLKRLKKDDNPLFKKTSIDYRESKIPSIKEGMNVNKYLKTTLDHTKFIFVKEGDVINLGDISFDIYEIPGHSKGSICLVEKSKKWAFTGDTITKYNIWNQGEVPEETQPLSALMKSYRKMEKVLDKEYKIYPAHGEKQIDISIIFQLEDAIKDLVNNHLNDSKIHTFIGDCYCHEYKERKILYSKQLLMEALKNGLQ